MVPKGFGRTTSRALFPHLTMRKRTPDLVWGKERESKHKKLKKTSGPEGIRTPDLQHVRLAS